ncbi:MAG TPA: hypothetical protein VJK51_01215 [Candidatus Nanoarchaeia archaeon]|nr:hypothetical protein [Candidatus Nanoarchaeia archaeon]
MNRRDKIILCGLAYVSLCFPQGYLTPRQKPEPIRICNLEDIKRELVRMSPYELESVRKRNYERSR